MAGVAYQCSSCLLFFQRCLAAICIWKPMYLEFNSRMIFSWKDYSVCFFLSFDYATDTSLFSYTNPAALADTFHSWEVINANDCHCCMPFFLQLIIVFKGSTDFEEARLKFSDFFVVAFVCVLVVFLRWERKVCIWLLYSWVRTKHDV